MKRVALAIVSTITGLVLLLSFKTHALGTATNPAAALSTSNGSGTSSSASNNGSSAGGTSGSGSTGSQATSSNQATRSTRTARTTVTGNAVETAYGPVEVRITVANGKVTAASAVEYPNQDPHDAQINAYAIPVLNQEAVQAGSANIAHVSGATYTSQGYIASLQSALNKAGL